MNQKTKPFWKYPWGYKEGFLIAFTLLVLGFILEFFTKGQTIIVPSWPVNIYIIIGLIGVIFIVQLYSKSNFVKWLSSVPAAITSISVFTLLIFLMGFIPQNDELVNPWMKSVGLSHLTLSWAYVLTASYLLIILGFTIVKRIMPFSIKNTAFFLNHAGLFIVLAAASLGSSDMWKANMRLVQDRAIFAANDYKGNTYNNIGFALKLIDFEIEEYTPQIGVYLKSSGNFNVEKGGKLLEATKGNTLQFDDWNLLVKDYYSDAVPDTAGNFIFSKTEGATTAAYIIANNTRTNQSKEGWVASGTYIYRNKTLDLDGALAIGMTVPSSKVFRSKIRAYKPKSVTEYTDINLEVNKPVEINGYTVYQTGYDETKGKYSQISIIELVYDPWLPAVYVGLFMMIAGSLYLAWM
ncbi:MAG: cytochrome c biogenesis protein ResB, partial [Bacteroidales bacterium]|nr:cytochrome c biogenesis protein ResB [Bacteroidales bacterium]